MSAQPRGLHVVFFPLMAPGHMIPVLDMAKLFATHHVKTTIITTPLNAPTFTKPLSNYNNISPQIDIEIIPFPSKEVGLPEGFENLDQSTSKEMNTKFLKAVDMLQEPLEQVLEKCKPNCLVADLLIPFATQVSSKFNIPLLVFHGTSFFGLCAFDALMKYEPYKSVSTDDEEFVIPHLPHEIKLTRAQVPENLKHNHQDELIEFFARAMESEVKSYGVVFNSFYELEQDYADHYRKVMGRRAWHIGPVSLCNREDEAKFQRGEDSSIDEHECLNWLDPKKPNSVIYICFGTMSMVSNSQLCEIAMGLEASGQDFIWVVRRRKEHENEENKEWLPNGFEERMKGKGLIVRGWAPQVLILGHEAIGGFVTHCGWNSTLEGISCGVPLVTWPTYADQFYNEKLVTEILKCGVSIGATQWSRKVENSVKWEGIKEAIERIMVGEEALEIRNRAKQLKEMAMKAVEEGGSSYCDLNSLIQELSSYNA